MKDMEKIYAGFLALVTGAGTIGAWFASNWLGLISTAFAVWASIEAILYYRGKRKKGDNGEV